MKNVIVIIVSLIFIVSCVGPEELLDGLSKNSPVVVNTNEAFTFSLRAVNYSTEETYNSSSHQFPSTITFTPQSSCHRI